MKDGVSFTPKLAGSECHKGERTCKQRAGEKGEKVLTGRLRLVTAVGRKMKRGMTQVVGGKKGVPGWDEKNTTGEAGKVKGGVAASLKEGEDHIQRKGLPMQNSPPHNR